MTQKLSLNAVSLWSIRKVDFADHLYTQTQETSDFPEVLITLKNIKYMHMIFDALCREGAAFACNRPLKRQIFTILFGLIFYTNPGFLLQDAFTCSQPGNQPVSHSSHRQKTR